MRELRRNMRVVGIIMLCMFIGVGSWFGYSAYLQGTRWMTSGNNRRINSARKTVTMGSITDRDGTLLAYTDTDGSRCYAAEREVRRAVSQTVGDTLSMSGTGVETMHTGILLGFSGSIIDRTWQWMIGENKRGDDIRLTIDAGLSAYISEQFPDGYTGAVAVINYRTGEVLAMVSKPDYDPYKAGTSDVVDTAYLNRCLQGKYAPGSVFKIITLAAALENMPGVSSRAYTCEGSRPFGDVPVTCAGGKIHGGLTLEEAFTESCNVTFAALSYELGGNKMVETANNFAFNDNFTFRDLVLYESSYPSDMASVAELAWSGVGQARVLVTPLHMAMIAGAIGNGGVMMTPKIIGQITGSTGIPRLRTDEGSYKTVISENTARIIGEYMKETVEDGTGYRAEVDGYTVCGKTGSAETSNDKSVATNAWFVGYIEEKSSPYAVAVVIEQGGSGGDKAARLAGKTLKKAIELIG
ncbi:MAG: penicillin-binding protein 2 [Clostridia bacterium]|nr:penicillin-binding protein 2 [Clostridia bacterium]